MNCPNCDHKIFSLKIRSQFNCPNCKSTLICDNYKNLALIATGILFLFVFINPIYYAGFLLGTVINMILGYVIFAICLSYLRCRIKP